MAKKILTLFGTRPEAIKLAPVIRELRSHEAFDCRIAVTGQHRDMLDQVLEFFQLEPDYDLDLMTTGQSLTDLTARSLKGLDRVLTEAAPDLVLVQGDTTTAFTAALAAYYHKIAIAHVEAGLRTGDKYSPWPEEANRRLITCLADYNFAPTATAAENLRQEGIPAARVQVTGNTVIDALLQTVGPAHRYRDQALTRLAAQPRRRLLVTLHRRENWGAPMRDIIAALVRILAEFPDTLLIAPLHKNPIVRDAWQGMAKDPERVHLLEPLAYADFANLMASSYLIITDSGGIQEEAPALGIPVVVARSATERPEAVACGAAVLAGITEAGIYEAVRILLTDAQTYERRAQAGSPYGDGNASRCIARYLMGI
jgi:UDP-N-acetylglucosamine 2-epimerase (non-hydrolysing)